MNIVSLFDRGASFGSDKTYLVCGENRITYGEAQNISHKIATALKDIALGKGNHGAVLSPNSHLAWLTTLGLWRAGLAWVPLNPRNPIADNLDLIDRFDVDILFFHSSFLPAIAQIRDQLSDELTLVCLDEENEFPSLQAWLADADDAPYPHTAGAEDLAMIMPTGGTTGKSKGVMLSHRNLLNFAANYMLNTPYFDERPVNLAAAPMTHTAGVLTMPAAARGGKIVILEKPDPALMLETVECERVTEFFLPPTVIYRLLQQDDITERNFSSLRYFIYGAAPMSTDKLRRAIDTFGPVMTQFYGQSEAPGAISCLTKEAHESANEQILSSCGHPSPLVSVTIRDSKGNQLPVGETGEICVLGDLVMKGYYKDPDKTADAIQDEWLYTGDIGHLDIDGCLHITDRAKDMIITGGFNVYPSEVEQVIWGHPSIQDCAVIGIPDGEWGERVHAVIELNPGAKLEAEELITLCKEKLGSVKAPKSVEFMNSLPRSAAGKVLKRQLRVPYWASQEKAI
ncbi:AMP-binding protein [Emcibacter nanhaiensis]|uniref:3-methylmercaptopropionyl-CoA ligase n=1 Tax=Emcibacter nanhaiensis TaxID=1505037 RepID=A0A501PFQ3_9PROT|nr:AMP-binding protein [Emcibacter nanhaiensis]TPD59260.1 long-chain fatty acid--CoA ligase [Emcibacter nanhaiensis]